MVVALRSVFDRFGAPRIRWIPMSLGLSALVVAGVLALHPFGSTAMQGGTLEPQPDPSWDEPDEPVADPAAAPAAAPAADPAADPTAEGQPTELAEDPGDPADALAPAPAPEAQPAPVGVPAPVSVARPAPKKGTGLIVGAGVTGGLAWITVVSRLTSLERCKTAAGNALLGEGGGFDAILACMRSTASLVTLTPMGWILNGATHGLAPSAGAVRGEYDGVRAAWDGAPDRDARVFVGVGAGLLGAGVVGRLATIVVFWRQFRLGTPVLLFRNYPLSVHFLMAQVSASSISAGAGMLAYGLSYKKHRTTEEGRRMAAGLAELRLAPQLGWDYTGLSLTGRF